MLLLLNWITFDERIRRILTNLLNRISTSLLKWNCNQFNQMNYIWCMDLIEFQRIDCILTNLLNWITFDLRIKWNEICNADIGQAIREQFHTRSPESGFRRRITRGIRSVRWSDCGDCCRAVDCRFRCARRPARRRLWPSSIGWRLPARAGEFARRRRVRSRLLFRGVADAAVERSAEHDSRRSGCWTTWRHQRRTRGQSGGHDPNSPDASSLIAGRQQQPLNLITDE